MIFLFLKNVLSPKTQVEICRPEYFIDKQLLELSRGFYSPEILFKGLISLYSHITISPIHTFMNIPAILLKNTQRFLIRAGIFTKV
jgi:hypothetical protein